MSKSMMMTGIGSGVSSGYDNTAFVVVPAGDSVPLPSYKTAMTKESEAAEPAKDKSPKTLAGLVGEFADNTTAHGVARIANASSCIAGFVWLVILCAAFSLFFLQGTNLVLDYFSWPYGTTIDVITKTNVEFPAVTVCNMNRLKRSKLKGTRFEGVIAIDGGISGGDNDYSWFFDWSSNANWINTYYSSSSNGGSVGPSSSPPVSPSPAGGMGSSASSVGGSASSVGSSASSVGGSASSVGSSASSVGGSFSSSGGFSYSSSSFYYADWLQDLGSLDDFNFQYDNYYDFGGVTGESDWDGFLANSKSEDFSDIINVANPSSDELRTLGHQAEDFILQCTFDKRKCNYTDFYMFQNALYGNCFTFNHGRNETVRATSKSGAQYGLHLTLFIEQPEYVGLFTPESGVRISVNHWEAEPHPGDSGITASTGQATSIAIRQRKIERLGGYYTNCTYGENTNFTSDFYKYSPLSCKKHCIQQYMKDSCNCVTDILLDGEKCSYLNSTQQRCRQFVEDLYEDDKLACYCPVACEETGFQASTSISTWPSERYEEHLYSRLSSKNAVAAQMLQNVETTRKNLARLRIYFEELNYQEVKQNPSWTFDSILGAVGGLMGLYVGISSITLFEIIVFVFSIFKFCCCKVLCLNKVHPSKN